MCNELMLKLSDLKLERLERGEYRPQTVVKRPFPGFGVLSVEIVNTPNERSSVRRQRAEAADVAAAASAASVG